MRSASAATGIGSSVLSEAGIRITRNQWGYDFLRLDNTFSGRSGEKPACDGGASNLDYSTIPEGGPELIISVPYTIEGKVAVRYVDDSGGCSSDDAL